MYATFDRFELKMTKAQAKGAFHQGRCDEDVQALSEVPAIRRQLEKLDPDTLRAELREYGAWDDDELSDHKENLQRILWLAAGNIVDGA